MCIVPNFFHSSQFHLYLPSSYSLHKFPHIFGTLPFRTYLPHLPSAHLPSVPTFHTFTFRTLMFALL
ncbi:hypothetical protein BGX38DRAFT_1157199 [Terfezia claveryi]|nr:hypothetical protein BGX38DRAFT_1157199 [Terfezia claveryi]